MGVIITLLLAIIAALAAILVVPEVRRWLRLDRVTQFNIAVPFHSIEVPRFGFRFLYPATWDRLDPTNSEGYTFVDPKDQSTRLAGWGGFVLDPECINSVRALAQDELARVQELPRFQLLESHAHGLHASRTLSSSDGLVFRTVEDMEGWRVHYGFRDKGRTMVCHQIHALRGNVRYCISFTATKRRYAALEEVALILLNGLQVFGDAEL